MNYPSQHKNKRQHLGIKKFAKTVMNASVKEAVCETGTKTWSTTHGQRYTFASFLFASAHSGPPVSLWTVHIDLRSLKRYQHIQKSEGLQQRQNQFTTMEDSVCVDNENNRSTLQPLLKRSCNVDVFGCVWSKGILPKMENGQNFDHGKMKGPFLGLKVTRYRPPTVRLLLLVQRLVVLQML